MKNIKTTKTRGVLCFLTVCLILNPVYAHKLRFLPEGDLDVLELDISDTATQEILVNDFLIKLENAQESLNTAMKNGDTLRIISCLLTVGNANRLIGSYEEALRHNQKALALSLTKKDSHYVSRSYRNLGNLYHFIGEYPKAIQYQKQALRWDASKALSLHCRSGLGNSFRMKGDYDSALYYYNLALEDWQMGEDHRINIATTIYRDKAKLLHAMGQYKKALDLHLRVLDEILAYQPVSTYSVAGSYVEIANLLLDSGEFPSAARYAKLGLDLSMQTNNIEHQKEACFVLYSSYLKRGNYKQALFYQSRHSLLKDSLFNATKARQISKIETQHLLAQKENKIQLLTQEEKVKNLKLQRRTNWIYTLVLLVVFLSVLAIILTKQFKLKAEQNSIELGLKLLRSQMNPHFIFNSLMAVQGFIYKKNLKGAGAYLSKFSKLVRLILENSRFEFISLEKELETLEFYFVMQSLRFSNEFSYSINVDPSLQLDSISIPPMFTQPFIENAIEHGILKHSEKGRVDISFRQDRDQLRVVVEDNGAGMDANKHLKKHQSLAIKMTKERIALLGKRHRYRVTSSIISKEQEGTLVTFAFPLEDKTQV